MNAWCSCLSSRAHNVPRMTGTSAHRRMAGKALLSSSSAECLDTNDSESWCDTVLRTKYLIEHLSSRLFSRLFSIVTPFSLTLLQTGLVSLANDFEDCSGLAPAHWRTVLPEGLMTRSQITPCTPTDAWQGMRCQM